MYIKPQAVGNVPSLRVSSVLFFFPPVLISGNIFISFDFSGYWSSLRQQYLEH